MGSLLRLLLTLSTLACIQRCKGSNGTDVEVQWWDAPARRWHTVPCHADTEAVMGQEGLSRRMVPDAGGGCGWFDVPGVATTTTPGRMFRTFVTSGRRLDVRARDLSASHATKYTLIVKSGVPPSTRHGSKDHDLRLEDVNPAFVQRSRRSPARSSSLSCSKRAASGSTCCARRASTARPSRCPLPGGPTATSRFGSCPRSYPPSPPSWSQSKIPTSPWRCCEVGGGRRSPLWSRNEATLMMTIWGGGRPCWCFLRRNGTTSRQAGAWTWRCATPTASESGASTCACSTASRPRSTL
eukprot:jgi/Mesvir1/7948/Mv11867-RA.3